MSASSSSSSLFSSTNRPQQHGFSASETAGIIRRTPPSAYSGRRQYPHSATSSSTTSGSMYLTPAQHRYQLPPTPLVLDPSAAVSVVSEGSEPRMGETVRKILEAATRRAVTTPPTDAAPTVGNQRNDTTAASFARSAPRAGFLSKFGTNIREYKRRFFVLKPSTHLYYFLSPSDAEPRGCIDLEGSTVQEEEHLADGRFRFALVLEDGRRVVLEARSEDVGRQWMHSLSVERLSHVRAEKDEQLRINMQQKARIAELEKQIEDFKLVEQDRDGALEDAANWKSRFERLNEGLRLLTQHLRRPPSEDAQHVTDEKIADLNDEKPGDDGEEEVGEPQPDDVNKDTADSKDLADDTDPEASSSPGANVSHRETSLLDAVSDEEQPIEELDIPGTHFSALTNASQQLRESVRLASIEASSAVEDLQAANEKMFATDKRMKKAEKHICKLWEENCEIRNQLKQNKSQKRILVREIKKLQTQTMRQIAPPPQERPSASTQEEAPSVAIGQEGERLIDELEEHVMSSIRLHEQFLGVSGGLSDQLIDSVNKIESGSYTAISPGPHRTQQSADDSGSTMRIENKFDPALEKSSVTAETATDTGKSGRMSPLRPKTLSLFDEESDDDDSDEEEDEQSAILSLVSSVGAEFGDDHPHPLLKLDEEDDAVAPPLCASSTQSESSKSVVTDTGQATARLSCPLADVVETKESNSEVRVDGRIYHLTFYSRKIGLQFQKVPVENSSRGLLTEAMTADLPGYTRNANGTATAAELQRIAAIFNRASSHMSGKEEEVCQVATPVHAVLVCGFHGFDDAANHSRPKLGARLVAFDGISVEVGKWTFDSVRKAIQARGRPLTLSFRNDFLTTKQRSILTKAVADIQAGIPPPRRTIQYKSNSRPDSKGPDSVQSALSHESERFVNENPSHPPDEDDDLSVSVASSTLHPIGHSFSTSRSVASHQNYRSFSQAGSSSVVSSTIGPLISNLMTGLSKKKETEGSDIPQYLRHDAESLENTPYYQDFKASLL